MTKPTDNTTQPSLKLATARTLKWNTIDRFSSMVLYAVTGIVLANIVSKEEFGLVGALTVFQAFAILFVDSGFGAALLRDKNPTERDYSTVFWFNLIVSLAIYAILFVCAPLIADIFQHNRRLIPLSKVMFLTFILNGAAIVQTNRLMKRMDVKQIAISNLAGLVVGAVIGITLALRGYGAWALVWQTVSLSAVKTIWLWCSEGWLPTAGFHIESLRKIWRVGLSVFSSSFLNTLCLNIYSFVIGAFYNLVSLGIYTQADKWSKMGSASISQILTASFIPVLARAQDDRPMFHHYMRKINRFTAFILFPALGGLALVGTPLFHLLFGHKWDAAIVPFQILSLRGIPIVLIALYSNYLLSLGYARKLFSVELIKDMMIVIAIVCTISNADLDLLVWGQAAASAATYIIVLCLVARSAGYKIRYMLLDLLPFALTTAGAALISSIFLYMPLSPAVTLVSVIISASGLYILACRLLRLSELSEAITYVTGRFCKRKPS